MKAILQEYIFLRNLLSSLRFDPSPSLAATRLSDEPGNNLIYTFTDTSPSSHTQRLTISDIRRDPRTRSERFLAEEGQSTPQYGHRRSEETT
jgi:hypothetical protein